PVSSPSPPSSTSPTSAKRRRGRTLVAPVFDAQPVEPQPRRPGRFNADEEEPAVPVEPAQDRSAEPARLPVAPTNDESPSFESSAAQTFPQEQAPASEPEGPPTQAQFAPRPALPTPAQTLSDLSAIRRYMGLAA